jgi:outer membrane protein assembly factor BamE (lipoprotein component of BamABCDE complex)
MLRRAAAILLLLAAAGCRSAPTEAMWQSVQIGMTGDEVKAILGEPDVVRYHKGRDIWFYHNRGVSFGPDGKVVGR